MKYSLRSKLSVSYVVVAFISILLLSVVTNYYLNKQFQDYVKYNQEQKNLEIVESLTRLYQVNGGWTDNHLQAVGVSSLEKGLIIRIRDENQDILWDANVHNSPKCQMIMRDMAKNMSRYQPGVQGSYEEKPYEIIAGGGIVGYVEVGYYTPFQLNQADLEFLDDLNKMQIGIGLFSLLMALLVGGFMARRLSTPISRVTKATQMISRGCYDERIEAESSTNEIEELTQAVNNLARNLENQERLRKRMTADVAHELRTPLATLQSHMEAMIEGIWDVDKTRLKSCQEEIMRISRMIGGLEKLARFESENLILDKAKFDISELITKILTNFETSFNAKEVELKFSGDKGTVIADRDKISQVMFNLLSNALKYTEHGGKIEIKVRHLKDSVEISVKDNGIGITEADLPFIFERFYRADKSRNRLTGGLGLGLTITKAIVDAHQGRINVKSKIGSGTLFTVTLPKE